MAKETNGGIWINVNGNDDKGHVNIYEKDPKGDHNSTHINIDYNNETFQITEKDGGEKTTTDGKCFLTTACMKHFQDTFDDSCYELTVLRWFRDNFVSKEDIEHYYKTAPIIVEAIENTPDNDALYKYIYEKVVVVCVDAIKQTNYKFAYNRYKNSILTLEEEFARPKLEQGLIKVLKLKTINN